MSIDNYGDLKAALGRLMHRSDLNQYFADVDEVVSIEIASRVEVWENQVFEELNDSKRDTSDRRLYGFVSAYPSYPLEIYSLSTDGVFQNKLIERNTVSQLKDKRRAGRIEDVTHYSFIRDPFNVIFSVEPPEGARFLCYMVNQPDALLADGDTTALLTNRPGIYLYCYAKHLAVIFQDDQMAQTYSNLFDEQVNLANEVYRKTVEGPVTIQGASTWL